MVQQQPHSTSREESDAEAQRPRPDDLAAPRLCPDECYAFGEEEEFAIQSNRPRATAIGLFARDHGAAFTEVSCRRRYMRFLTRQESYEENEEQHIDNQFWSWFDNHDPDLTRDATPGHACRAPDGSEVTPPEFDQTVPSDWTPEEADPVWAFCERKHPDAIRCWEPSER